MHSTYSTYPLDLATHCRMLLYNRPKHTLLCRWLLLYPLYILCEIAIISTDLAELLGSAIALVLLFPSLPLWAGVLLTASDVLFILALGDPTRGRPVRLFEFLIAGLVRIFQGDFRSPLTDCFFATGRSSLCVSDCRHCESYPGLGRYTRRLSAFQDPIQTGWPLHLCVLYHLSHRCVFIC